MLLRVLQSRQYPKNDLMIITETIFIPTPGAYPQAINIGKKTNIKIKLLFDKQLIPITIPNSSNVNIPSYDALPDLSLSASLLDNAGTETGDIELENGTIELTVTGTGSIVIE